MNIFAPSLAGMTSGAARFERAAKDTVQAASGVSDASLEGSIQAEVQFRASAAAFETADEMTQRLLDIKV